MLRASRDTTTVELLANEGIDASTVTGVDRARARMMITLLGGLPDGFRVEVVRGRPEPGRDPGCELTLVDERRRPERVVGRVSRRLIGEQRVSWTGARLTTPATMEAFAVVMRLAVADAEGRGRR